MKSGIQQPFFSCTQMTGGSQVWQPLDLSNQDSYVCTKTNSHTATQTHDQKTFLMQLKKFTGKRKIDSHKSQERERTVYQLSPRDLPSSPQNGAKRRRKQIGYWNFLPQQFTQQKQTPPTHPTIPFRQPKTPKSIEARELKSLLQKQKEQDEQFQALNYHLSKGTIVQPGTQSLPPIHKPNYKNNNTRGLFQQSFNEAVHSYIPALTPTLNPTPQAPPCSTPTINSDSRSSPKHKPTPTPAPASKVTPTSILNPPFSSTPSSTCSTEQNSESDKETYTTKWECKIVDRKGFELMKVHADLNTEISALLTNSLVLIGYTKRSQLMNTKIENTVRVTPKGKKIGIQKVAQMKLVGIIEGENDQYDFALVFDQPKVFVQLAFIEKGFVSQLKSQNKLLM